MDLEALRSKIDDINSQLLTLFEQRMELTEQVAIYKKENNLPIFQPDREQEILSRIIKQTEKEENRQATKVFFSVLMDISKCQQKRVVSETTEITQKIQSSLHIPCKPARTVACQGVPGAYSNLAAEQIFGQPNISYYQSFEDVFDAVENNRADYGILPIDNSSAGTVGEVYTLMRKHSFFICHSTKVKVEHCLCAKPGVPLEKITDVFTHIQALRQCSNFLSAHPALIQHEYSNTAAAAKYVAESKDFSAAICSERSARLYGLQILKQNVQNTDENYTRFICFSKELRIPEENNRISIALSIPNYAGSLYKLLTKFAVADVNMSKIESKPMGTRNFDFIFYIDFSGSLTDPSILELLNDLAQEYEYFKFFGSYCEK